ncbi:MAG: GNAT family N-acetyltransferase [Promethearchaeia archaeon]
MGEVLPYDMKTNNLSKDLIVRDVKKEDKSAIIKLVTRIYGSAYYHQGFYEESIIADYIHDAIHKQKRKIYWKVALYHGELIGQMMFIIKHGAAFLIFTMVDPRYEGKNVITSISLEMVKILAERDQDDMRCIFAFIDNTNIAMEKVLLKFNFRKLGHIPDFRDSGKIKIYGRIVYDFRWRMINPHIKIAPLVYDTARRVKVHRIVLAMSMPIHSNGREKKAFIISQNGLKGERMISTKDGQECAKFVEEKNNSVWRDFMITENLSFTTKKHLIRFFLKQFQHTPEIRGVSFALAMKDVASRWLLINKNTQFGPYLPFYFGKENALLMYMEKNEGVAC